jgi:hypothetical protein
MSQAELSTGKDPQRRKLAKEIGDSADRALLKKYEKQSDGATRE